jgi:hypothetical protein
MVFPIWTFYLGTQYEKTATELAYYSAPPVILTNNSSGDTTLPTTTPEVKLDSGIRGIVTIGPTCPVERIPPDPECASKPYATNLVAINRISALQTKFSSSEDGTFKLNLPPGDYSIRNTSTSTLPRMEDQEITVYAHKYTELNIEFDSGIR